MFYFFIFTTFERDFEMKPTVFKEQNNIYTGVNCGELPVLKLDDQIISKWELSFFERIKLLFTGAVWLGVAGKQQPPVYITAKKPFEVR